MLTGGFAAAVWVCVPIVISLVAVRHRWPAAPTAALVYAIILVVFGIFSNWNAKMDAPVISVQPGMDTYYVAATGHYQIGL